MDKAELVIAGAGIGGLAAAFALARQGQPVTVLERADAFAEVGAGVQMGPNVTRILQAWGLNDALQAVAAFPQRLQARDARSGRLVGELPLGHRTQAVYGAPYATLHRADLHTLLAQAALKAGAQVQLGRTLEQVRDEGPLLRLEGHDNKTGPWCSQVQALVGADGIWGRTRHFIGLNDAPRFSGQLAYRALVPQADLPAHLRTDQVTVWMGPKLHVVHYPVQAGAGQNIVAIVHGAKPQDPQAWDQAAVQQTLWAGLGDVCPVLRERLQAVPSWRLWALHDRSPLSHAGQMTKGRIALLGDAAHPMRPYLAQGAGMAIEDAHALAQCWGRPGTVEQRWAQYAQQRWARNAHVQSRSIRNGEIFHAQGAIALGRNLSLRLLGARLMDVPWLYGA
ncbi:MAG: 3-hydroxybenzoate 6-hydroxylase 1 [Pseudomonadota bacterium]|jgi:salicylate hydroxylase